MAVAVGDGGRMLNLRRLHLSFYDQSASVLLYQHGAILPKAKKAWGKVCSSFRHKSRESTKKYFQETDTEEEGGSKLAKKLVICVWLQQKI